MLPILCNYGKTKWNILFASELIIGKKTMSKWFFTFYDLFYAAELAIGHLIILSYKRKTTHTKLCAFVIDKEAISFFFSGGIRMWIHRWMNTSSRTMARTATRKSCFTTTPASRFTFTTWRHRSGLMVITIIFTDCREGNVFTLICLITGGGDFPSGRRTR